jgi:flagellar capping protein FliD
MGSYRSSSLLSAAESLATDDVFSIVSANSDDSGRVSVNATNEAAAGNFSVEVVELAQSRRLSSGSFSSLSNPLNISGEFVINGQGVEIDDDDDLLDIRDKINSADAGVTAQLLVSPSRMPVLLMYCRGWVSLRVGRISKMPLPTEDAAVNFWLLTRP